MADALTGRDRELALLNDFLGRSCVEGGALLLVGEPGVGKTALLRAAVAQARACGTRILQTAATEADQLSYSGLAQVAMPLLAHADRLTTAHRKAASVALGLAHGRPPQPAAVSQAVFALLRSASAEAPVLIAVDDLQWLDPYSRQVLSFVACHVPGSRVALLAASRSALGQFDQAGAERYEVPALDATASDALLRARFPALTPQVRQRVVSEAAGNPLALLELPTALAGSQFPALRALPTVLPLSDRLQAVFAARVTQLPAATRDLLLLAALDTTGDLHVLRAAAGHPVLDDLAPAERERLIHVVDELHQVSFRHPLTRSAVAGLATAAERARAHQALARALADQPSQRAPHLAASTDQPNEVVAAQLEQCARHIARRGDAAGAVAALTRAADLSPGPGNRRRRLAEAAFIGSDMGWQLPASASLLDRSRDIELDAPGALHLAAAAACIGLASGRDDIDAIHRLLVTAIEAHAGSYEASDEGLIAAVGTLTWLCMFGGRPELWRPCRAALDRIGPAAPRGLRLQAAVQGDPAREAVPALADLDAAIAGLHNETNEDDLLRIPAAASFVDRVSACREALYRQISAEHESGAAARAAVARIYLWVDEFASGRWAAADQLASNILAACTAADAVLYAQIGKYYTALLAAARGDDDAVAAVTGELTAWAAARGSRMIHVFAWHARALAASGKGDFEAAYQNAAAISPAGTFAAYRPTALRVCLELVEGAARAGRRDAARAHVDAMNLHDLPSVSPHLALVTHGCAGMAADDEDEAAHLFRRALAVPGADRSPFDYARVQLAYGERLRRARGGREARDHLQAAHASFADLGARPWAVRAARELRALPGTAPAARHGTTGPGALTPQELEIAQLAAAGYSNKQIGARLQLSPRTVSTHLYRIFPKLSITSRAALRDALSPAPSPTG